jgi:hypothetical protein
MTKACHSNQLQHVNHVLSMCVCHGVCVNWRIWTDWLKIADLDGERLGVGVSFDEQHPHYAEIRDVDLVSAVIVFEKRARIPHGFALSWDIETALVSALTCFTSAHGAGAGGAKGERPIHVCSFRYMCVLILLYMRQQLTRRRRAVVKSPTNYLRVRILLYLCPHATMCVSPYILLYKCPHTTICVLQLLYMCPHTAIYVSPYYYMCPHTNFTCVLILLYVSSYNYISVRIRLY